MNENTSVQINVALEDWFFVIRQSPDNFKWTEILVKDICPSHFDSSRDFKSFVTFENDELDNLIKALTAYRDTIKMLG